MVLKKTNTVLNTGATQRVTNGHVFLHRDNLLSIPERNQINCHLIGPMNSFSHKDNDKMASILNFLSEMFGCEEIGYLTRQAPRRWQVIKNESFLFLSVNRKKRWLLAEVISNLVLHPHDKQTDAQTPDIPAIVTTGFEDTLIRHREAVEINVRNASLVKSNTSVSLSMCSPHTNTTRVSTNQTHSTQHSACSNRVSTKTTHFRGIQRLNPTHSNNKTRPTKKKRGKRKRVQEEVDQEENTPTSNLANTPDMSRQSHNPGPYRLHIDIVGDFQHDSRCATVKTQWKKWSIRPYNTPRVALCKGKGSSKGRRVGPRTYSYADLREDIRDAQTLNLW